MKELPIKHSPYVFDYDEILKMSEAERSKLYTTNNNTDFKPYTVIDVLKKVFHRDFIDDLMYSFEREQRSLESFKKSDDDWNIVQYWIDAFDVIRPESVFGQPIYDHLVDIYAEVGIRILEMDSYGERNIYSIKIIPTGSKWSVSSVSQSANSVLVCCSQKEKTQQEHR